MVTEKDFVSKLFFFNLAPGTFLLLRCDPKIFAKNIS